MEDSTRTLNPASERKLNSADSDWCVGEPPMRWDISLTSLVAEQFRRWFGRTEDRKIQMGDPSTRKAA